MLSEIIDKKRYKNEKRYSIGDRFTSPLYIAYARVYRVYDEQSYVVHNVIQYIDAGLNLNKFTRTGFDCKPYA